MLDLKSIRQALTLDEHLIAAARKSSFRSDKNVCSQELGLSPFPSCHSEVLGTSAAPPLSGGRPRRRGSGAFGRMPTSPGQGRRVYS